MAVYYGIALVSCLLTMLSSWLRERSVILSWACFACSILIFCHFAGARDISIGTDTSIYGLRSFYAASVQDFDFFFYESEFSRWAPLSKAVMWCVARYTQSKYWYFFSIELVVVLPVAMVLKRNFDGFAALGMLVFGIAFYPSSFNLMRQMMGMGFILLSYRPAAENKPLGFVACVLVGAGFHTSLLMGLAVFPLVRYSRSAHGQYPWVKMLSLTGLVILGLVFASPLLEFVTTSTRLYEEYVTGMAVTSGGGRRYAVGAIALVLASGAIGRAASDRTFMLHSDAMTLYLLTLVGALCLPLSAISMWLYRIGFTYLYFLLLAIPTMASALKDNRLGVLFVMLVIAMIGAWAFDGYVVQGRDQVVPYQSSSYFYTYSWM